MLLALADIIRAILLTIRQWFFRFIPRQSYLYMACGGINLVFDMAVFYVAYHYLFLGQNFKTPFFTFSPHIASLIVAFSCSTPTGFFLSRYVVWTTSTVQAKQQAAGYLTVVFICILLNVGFLKLFIETFYFYPLPAKLLTSVLVVATSYVLQRYYAFKVHKSVEPAN
ncbi:MAG: GtrA family protein [Chitinophagales bacterium]|nr:GtrA family protein [Chitinophagales bacterium]